MKIGAIIFSRLDSSRLPGKALIDIEGRPLLGRVIDRARRVSGVETIIVATSDRILDDPICEFAASEAVSTYRGDVDKVAERALGACDAHDLDAFVRICGDRPFFDPSLINQMVQTYKADDIDLLTTTAKRALPPGLTGEIVNARTFRQALPAFDANEQEHLTMHFYQNAKRFKIRAMAPPGYVDFEAGTRLVVDDAHDLERARAIASGITNLVDQDEEMDEIISLAKRWDTENTAKGNI